MLFQSLKKEINKFIKIIGLFRFCQFLEKILERLIFEEMFPFFIENKLIAANQSGFKTGDSCINQLIAITHEIYQSFDAGYKVRGVFLDISKAFDKVWHEGLIFKLKQNCISI